MNVSVLLPGLLAGLAAAMLLRRRCRRDVLAALAPTGEMDGRSWAPGGPAGAAAGSRPAGVPAGRRPRPLLSPALACGLAAGAAAVLLPWPLAGLVALAVLVAGPRLLSRLEPAAVRRDRERLAGELPLVLDLLGACVAGGASLPAAAAAVAGAVRGPAGPRLARVATALAVGTPADSAWLLLCDAAAGADDPLGPAARALSRSADSGARVADVLARLAEEERRRSRARAAEAARRVGVLAVAPLGLCHLPSFVLLGVVPVVAGLAAPLLTQA